MRCVLRSGKIIECKKIHFNQNGAVYIKTIEKTTRINSRLLAEVIE
jgi:hypothetical protein